LATRTRRPWAAFTQSSPWCVTSAPNHAIEEAQDQGIGGIEMGAVLELKVERIVVEANMVPRGFLASLK
jgi:hypothetical protein